MTATRIGEWVAEAPPADSPVIWEPQPGPQAGLLECPIEDVFFGGARGGGKTDGLLGDFAEQAGTYGSGARGILFRRTYPEMEEVERRAREMYRPLGAIYNAGSRTWTFKNGATLRLRHLDRDEHADEYQGHQYTWLGFDELQNWPTSRPIDKLWATLRSAHGVPCVRRSTGNPGGVGHQWVKARYVEPAPPGEPFEYQPQPDVEFRVQAVFIPSQLEDNPLLMLNDPRYEGRLSAVGGPELYRGWRYGDWNITAGAALEIVPAVHIVKTFPHGVPKQWEMFGGFDWGYAHPYSFSTYAVNEDGRVFCIDTIRNRRFRDPEIIKDIKARCPYWERLEHIVAGTDCWAKKGDNQPTTFERFAENGLLLAQANTDRIPGLRNFREYLAWKGTAPDGSDDDPRFVWCDTPGNRRAIIAIQSIVSNPDSPEDALKVDASDSGIGGDDDYDQTRYALASRPMDGVSTWSKGDFDAFSKEALELEAQRQRRSKRPKSGRGPLPDAVT